MQALDDVTLLREYAANNSEAAFETLVTRHIRLVYSAALRQTCDPELAEEVTQAVFTLLARKASQLSRNIILAGWLFKTTRYISMAQNRNVTRQRKLEQKFQMQAEGQCSAPDPLWEQIAPLLDDALMQLSEKDRQAVLLRYMEGRNLAEIGGAMGTGEDAARMRINRALEKLQSYLRRRGITSTTMIITGFLSASAVQAAPVGLSKSMIAVGVAKGMGASGGIQALLAEASKLILCSKIKAALPLVMAVLLVQRKNPCPPGMVRKEV